MNEMVREFTMGLPDAAELARAVVRLTAAVVFGGIVGIERERAGKAAGLRTHMLVALGAALVMLACAESGMATGDLSRVAQGVITGIGFLGAGSILKSEHAREIHGLTTAAGIWLTAGVGVAAGLGRWFMAGMAAVASWIILGLLSSLERKLDVNEPRKSESA
jgi:putative Mg2+ transporter-C (MgtC) family protein